MMFDLFKSVANLAGNVVEVVTAPVVLAVDLVDAAVKPLAEVAKDLKDDIKSLNE